MCGIFPVRYRTAMYKIEQYIIRLLNKTYYKLFFCVTLLRQYLLIKRRNL